MENDQMDPSCVSVRSIRLRRRGGEDDPKAEAVVDVELISGQWVEAMSEELDSNFSHCVSASGILDSKRSEI